MGKRPRMTQDERIEAARLLNRLGKEKILAAYQHHYPPRVEDRRIDIAIYTLRYGPTVAAQRFGVSKQAAQQTLASVLRRAREAESREDMDK